jgi:hypothetical protein
VAIRFDAGTIRKSEFTPEGYFRAEAVFARDGILEYRTPDGQVRKELRTPEANKKALLGYGLKPISLEHPPVLINSLNAKDYSVGMSDSTVVYDPNGFIRGVITVLDSEAVKSISEGKTLQISAGYKCNIDSTPGMWRGQPYDAIQTDVEINHIALTERGRAGPDVKIYFDSADLDDDIAFQEVVKQDKKRMARVTIDSVTYDDIPETFASVTGQKIQEAEKAKARIDSLESERKTLDSQITELKKELLEAEEERDRALGRADGFEEIVNSAIPVLEESGYSWNADAAEFVADAAAKKTAKKSTPPKAKDKDMDDDDDDDDEDDEDMEDEEDGDDDEDDDEDEDEDEDEEAVEPVKPAKTTEKKAPKKGGKSSKKDSISNILATWKKAESLGIEESRFDSELDADGVRRMVLAELLPDTDISGYSPAWVEGLFDSMYLESSQEEEEPRGDSTLQDMVRIAKTPQPQLSAIADENSKALANAWQAPLSLTRAKR